MNRRLSLLLLAPVLFIACDKNDSSPAADAKTTLITSSSWKYENAGVDGDRNGSIDLPLPAALPACLRDNTLTLSANGTGTVDEGPSKCDPAAPQSTPATWSFASNQTMLNLGGSGIGVSGQLKIVELSATNLTLSKDTSFAGFPVAIIVQLKH
jgi:hypothetical protein